MHDVKTKRNGLIIELQCDDIKEDNPVMSQPGLSDVTLLGRGDATGAQIQNLNGKTKVLKAACINSWGGWKY